MRLKSSIWVSAYIRRCGIDHIPVMVMRRGAEAAGAIFIKINKLDGSVILFGPAPQTSFEEEGTGRFWMALKGGKSLPESDVDKLLEREINFDPDIWILEVEDRQGRDFLHDERIEG